MKRRTGAGAWLIVLALGPSCRSEDAAATKGSQSAPAATPETFVFEPATGFSRLELNPAGELLMAPAGAAVTGKNPRFVVRAGESFAVEVDLQASGRSDLDSRAAADEIAVREDDLIVFGSAGRYRFVVVREVVPEWDESDRRHYACSSVGVLSARADAATFARPAIERMVAACRTLSVPKLE